MSLPSQWDRPGQAVEHRLGCASRPDSDRPLEATVVAEHGEQPHVRISRLGYGGGVGWYAQQSLDLTLEEAQRLVRVLSEAPQPETAGPLEGTETPPVSLDAFRARKRAARP